MQSFPNKTSLLFFAEGWGKLLHEWESALFCSFERGLLPRQFLKMSFKCHCTPKGMFWELQLGVPERHLACTES